jgi:hypothetical protein
LLFNFNSCQIEKEKFIPKFHSCSNCDFSLIRLYETGPQGPIGPQGLQGIGGPAGPQGPQGAAGTANVIYSEWNSSLSGTFAAWSVPAITQGVLDSAVILVYLKQGTAVYQLPYDNVNGSGFYINDFLFVGSIDILCSAAYNLNQFSFRYVIIPGAVLSQSVRGNYEQITNMFNITP